MKNQLRWGSVLSYIQIGANVLVNLLFTPIMIRLLGTSEYGLYNTVASTISMLSILSLGFNSGYIKFFSKYKADEDYESIRKLNGLFLSVFLVIGLVALACGLFLAQNLDIVFEQGLTAREYDIARILMMLLTFNLAISFPFSVFSSIIAAHERFIYLKIVGMVKTVCGPLVSIPLLLMGFQSIAMVSAMVAFYIVADLMLMFYALRELKVKFIFGRVEKGLLKGVFSYTVFIALNIIVDQANWNIGKIILGRYKGTTAVGIYSVAYTLAHAYNMFSTSISGVFTPRIHRIINSVSDSVKRDEKLTELFIKIGRLQFLILGLIASGFVFFGKAFITQFWAGSEFDESYYVTLLLIFPVTIPLMQNVGIEIQRALNKHQFRSIIYVIMAVINVAVSVVLCQKYGAVGCAMGTATSLLLANGLVMNVFYQKKCGINVVLFWRNILSAAKGLLLPVAIGILMRYVVDLNTIEGFLSGILIYTMVYSASMWVFGMNSYEKLLIENVFKKLRRRMRRVMN